MASLTVGFSSLPAVGYYMAVSALTGQKKDISHLKLLLPNLQPHSNFCLLFHYRLAANKVGKLRVFAKNRNNALAWEKTWSTDERWRMGKTQLYHGIDTPKSVSGKLYKMRLFITYSYQMIVKYIKKLFLLYFLH